MSRYVNSAMGTSRRAEAWTLLEIILSPAGDRALEVTGAATFRLVAWPSRVPVVSLAGSEPRFSRVVTVLAVGEDGEDL